MKMLMMVLSLGLISATSVSMADQSVLTCSGSRSVFTVTQIGINSYEGSLTVDGTAYSLTCEAPLNTGNSNVYSIITCIENRSSDGKFLVDVQSGGFSGSLKFAYVSQEQIYPFQPQVVDTANCN